MKPRTTVVIAGGLFALATFVAIIVVLTGGSDGVRKHRRIADVADEADGYGGVVHYHMMTSLDPASAARRVAAVHPQLTIDIDERRVALWLTDAPDPSPPIEISRTDPSHDLWRELADDLVTLHDRAGTDAEVIIRSDASLPHGFVVQIMDAAKAAGFERLSLQTH